MGDRYVTVYHTYDPIQADILGDLLGQEGIPARVLGTRHGAVIGVGQNICQLHIEVPGDQAAAAADLIEAFVQSPPEVEDDEDDEAAEEASAPAGAAPERRSPLLAAGSTFAIFGGSHLYGRRPWAAAVVAAAEIGGLVSLMGAGADWDATVAALILMVGAVAYDLIAGQLVVRAYNRGVRPGAGRQVITGLIGVGAIALLAQLVAPHVPPPEREDDTLLPVLYDQRDVDVNVLPGALLELPLSR